MAFSDKITPLAPGVFVYKNFLSAEELIEVQNELNVFDWENCTREDVKNFQSLRKYENRLKSALNNNNYSIDPMSSFTRRVAGQGMAPHVDILNFWNKIRSLEVDEDFNQDVVIQRMAKYAFVFYPNDDYEGGELSYPEYDIDIKPEAGSLFIHDSRVVHGVKKVISGIRYSHQNVINKDYTLWASKFNELDIPDLKFYDNSKEEFYYSIDHGISQNPRLEMFRSKNPTLDEYISNPR